MRSSDHKNAANVLPEPVGATTRVLSPRAIVFHACACAAVGAVNAELNQAAVIGEKPDGMAGPRSRGSSSSGPVFLVTPRFWTVLPTLVGLGEPRRRCDTARVRYLHRWFDWFERHTRPSAYRVFAVAAGAALTAVCLGLALAAVLHVGVAVSIVLQYPLAVLVWVLLGVIEGAVSRSRRAARPPRPPHAGVREPRRPVLPPSAAPRYRRVREHAVPGKPPRIDDPPRGTRSRSGTSDLVV